MVIHWRLNRRPQGRPGYSRRHFERLGVAGTTWTACGAPVTDADLTARDLRRSLADPAWAARVCAACARRGREEGRWP